MKKYDFKIEDPPMSYRYSNLVEWFKMQQDDGWELLGPNYTAVNNGNSYIASYIFRKEIENNDKDLGI